MKKPGIEDLLIRCVLEPELLQELRVSPESVFDSFDLSDRARELLSEPDARLLELLGEAVEQRTDAPSSRREGKPEAAKPQPAAALEEPAGVMSLPESRLALRLVPYVQQAAASTGEAPEIVVNYAGHLDPLPGDADLEDLPQVPEAVTDGQQLPPVSIVVSVQPTAWTDDTGNQQMTFSVSARLPQDGVDADSGNRTEVRLSPWRHDVDSPDVRAAAERVRNAQADDRYHRLRELIDVMVASPGEAR